MMMNMGPDAAKRYAELMEEHRLREKDPWRERPLQPGQCPAPGPMGIQCVLAEGHEPFIDNGNEDFIHNWGGLGPFGYGTPAG